MFHTPLFAADDYRLGPDSQRKPDVPKGEVKQFKWTSKIFPDTERDCWVYTPSGYDGQTPLCVMIFQDGGGYVSETASFRVPIVFDNVIHQKQISPTCGNFLSPDHRWQRRA